MWHELHRIRRDQAATQELPVAQLAAMLANIHRDSKKQAKPFALLDFCLFRENDQPDDTLSAEVAAVALDLRHEGRCPALLLTIWPQVLAAAAEGTKMPSVRALHTADDAVWVLAPKWEGPHVRGGLVLVRGQISGSVVLRELDRPLLTHRLKLPSRQGFGWLETGLLLVSEES